MNVGKKLIQAPHSTFDPLSKEKLDVEPDYETKPLKPLIN